ncbi:MAG: NAD(P)H-binding protein [Cyanobacteria bacterium TGS_CYA1]|nr:NAD(P)H-binding protein [Cyanobacteria bacterium TGS_CYA1]
MSTKKLLLVLGATGFLGSIVIKKLLAEKYSVRIVTRGEGDWQDNAASKYRKLGIDVIIGDLATPRIMERAVDNAAAIINLAGVLRESKGVSFEFLHVEAIQQLVQMAQAAGIERYVHVSCLGAHIDSQSTCYETKWAGEDIIRQSKFYWTIFRPSFLFGERFPLVEELKPLITCKMFLPFVGSGVNRIQPIFVNDVASCVTQSIYMRDSVSQTYDLTGPKEYPILDLLLSVRKALQIPGDPMNIPSNFLENKLASNAIKLASQALPKNFLNNDIIKLAAENSCGSQDAMLKNFEVRNATVEQYFEKIIDSLRQKPITK